jgi:hypothetical protein
MEPTTPAAIADHATPAPQAPWLWAFGVLIPAPWLALLLSRSVHAVLAAEPAWVQDLVAGQLMAISVFVALGGSAWAWRRLVGDGRGPMGFFPQAVVASHAGYLAAVGLAC